MKSVFLFIIVLCSYSAHLQAQTVWSTEGATWHYTRTEEYWPARPRPLLYDFTKVTVGPSKLINGKTCSSYEVSNPDSCNPLIGTFYCYEEARKLYYYYEDSNTFSLLYDFSLAPGDSLLTKSSAGVLITYIDSISSVVVDDTTLTLQYIHYGNIGVLDHPGRIFLTHPKNQNFNIEGIGNTFNFFPWWFGLCHNVRSTNLRCFENENFRYFYAPEWTEHCDSIYLWEPQSIESSSTSAIRIYPNPARERVQVNGLTEDSEIRLFNALGKEYPIADPIKSGNARSFSVSRLPTGVYLLQVDQQNFQQTVRLLVE